MDLEKLTNDELRAFQRSAADIISKRQERRKKELWGNVVAAIHKYQDEMNEQIDIIGKGDMLAPFPGQRIIGALETV